MLAEHKIVIIIPNANVLEDQKTPYQWQLYERKGTAVTWDLLSKGKATTKDEAFEKAVAAHDSIEL